MFYKHGIRHGLRALLGKLQAGFACAAITVLAVSVAQADSGKPELCLQAQVQSANDGVSPASLPQRDGPPIRTSGRVPHIQLDVEPVSEINQALYRFAFSLPGVERRATGVSLPGAVGMWLDKSVTIVRPKAIAGGREFSHIHTDGSLHLPLPPGRALELTDKGWGERHPWAERRDGWEGFVMLFTPVSPRQLQVVTQIIAESYNFVTGQNARVSAC